LFELPVGISPRVHRLSVRPYLIYGITAFRLLNRPPPATGRTDTFNPGATQIGTEVSAVNEVTGVQCVTGFDAGSNNRIDNNSSYDLFLRVGLDRATQRTGLFFYYSPDVLGDGGNDEVFRFGPDYTYTSRRIRLTGQSLAGFDANPTNHGEALWFYGGFVEGTYRFTPTLISLARVDYAGMPAFNDRPEGGTTNVHRYICEMTAGLQYLVRENLKLVAEVTHSENHDAVNNSTLTGWAATVRFATAFWPLTPPLLSEVLPRTWRQ